jgi:basic membrane lipoprotein Med (substrate-binding protein (PBP1-ABC) superfamily)
MTLDARHMVPGMDKHLAKPAGIVTLTAGVVTLVGSFLPWASVWFVHKNGIDGDGAITAVLGVMIAVCGLMMLVKANLAAPIIAIISAILAVGVVYYDMYDIVHKNVTVEYGMYLTWLGVTAAGIGGALHLAAVTPRN